MKKLLIISFFFFSLIYSQENRINSVHVVMKDGLFYDLNEFFVTDTPTPYSGKVVTIIETEGLDSDYGSYVHTEYYILNGKKHGNYKKWYESGILETEGTYKDGELDGVWIEYTHLGKVKSKKTWENGKIKSSGPRKW